MKVDEFILNVKLITEQGVAEIIKQSPWWYTFRVSTTWYNVNYNNDFGMFLRCDKGESVTSITTNIFNSEPLIGNKSELRKKGDTMFDYLEKIYIAQRVFSNDKIVKSLRNYLSFIEKATHVDKLSNSIFDVEIDGVKYIFERNDKFSFERNLVLPTLEIKYLSNNKLKIKSVEDYTKIDSIFAVLNAIFYLNKTVDEGIKEDEIFELLKI
jgi:hypothetical protein